MKLISLNQFVAQQYINYEKDIITAEVYANRVKNYAKFLETTITKEIFKGKTKLVNGYIETKKPVEIWTNKDFCYQKWGNDSDRYTLGKGEDVFSEYECDTSPVWFDRSTTILRLLPLQEDHPITLTKNATKLFL